MNHPVEDAGREQQLELVIADYIRACEAGAPPDRREVVERHPELAAELQEFFRQRDHMNQLAEPIRRFGDTLAHVVAPGQRLSYVGNYELLEEVARGGMGIVYKARQTTLGRIVAVKMILAGQLASEQDVKRFQSEAQAAAGLQHPNIVSIHEVGEHEGWHYFSMDYVAGRDLATILRENLLPAKQAATYVREMAEAIHYAHQQGTLHRDLKPSNVLIDDHDQVRITDFGLAMRVEGDSELTRSGQILGTPSYMPPEQAQGQRELIGPASDVYALGAVLYECLTGRPPFRAESAIETIQQVISAEPAAPRLLNHDVPRDLETICLKCLQKEPHRRYGTAQLLADDLGCFLRGEPITARPISRPARAWRWCRRNPVVAGLSTAMIVLLVSIATLATAGYVRESESNRQLTDEQQRSSGLQLSVADLEQRRIELESSLKQGEVHRSELDSSLKKGAAQLAQGEKKLSETYLELARAAWRAKSVELADYYLNLCPPLLRTTVWHDLKRRYHPNLVTFAGQNCVALSNDGTLLAAAAEENTVKVWEVSTRRLLHTLRGHDSPVSAIDFSPDGKQLATAGRSPVILWDLARGTKVRELTGSNPFLVTDIDFHPKEHQLATAGFYWAEQGQVVLWDLKTYQQTYQQVKSLSGLQHVVISQDGQWLATSRPKGDLCVTVVFNLSSADPEVSSPWLVVDGNSKWCRPAFHPLRNELAIANGGSVELWDMERKQNVGRLVGEQTVDCLAYSADGKRLACAGTLRGTTDRNEAYRTVIWNLSLREPERTLPWYSSAVTSMSFTPDGRELATADAGVVKLWDVTPPADPTDTILNDIVELKVGKHDWPQWGGSRARVNTPAGKNIPTTWNVGDIDHKTGSWQKQNSRNIKWAARLGSQTYGNPVVANGRVYIGTNNTGGYLKRYPSDFDLGVLLCLEEQTGNFLWQHSNEKLPTGRVHDWPLQGVCSTPMVDGNRLWYVSNRGEVVCLDTEGFYDGEDDGPVQNEWVRLFQVNARLHGRMKNGVPDELRAGFAKAGLTLPPSSIWYRQETNGTSWTIGHQHGLPLYRIQLVGDKLRVSAVAADDTPAVPPELFSLDDHLLPHLGTSQIVLALRAQLEKHGIQQLPEIEPSTEDPGKVWSFVGILNERRQSFQVRDEGTYVSIYKQLATSDKDEADVVWKLDMMTELGVSQHNMATCSVLTVDGMLFVCTSNGVDETHINIPAPDAPSFIALDRETGKVIWTDKSPGKNILHGQWASPSYAVFAGQPQVIFPGGDGWVYSFDPKGDGLGGSKLLWKFDGNPKTSKYSIDARSTRNYFFAFPAIYDGLVYVVMGEDPEHGEGEGHLWCIDPAKRMDGGDVSADLAVDSEGNVVPHRRHQAIDPTQGERAIPNPHSAVVWHYAQQDQNQDGKMSFEETLHRSLGTPVIKDDILYIADFSGLFHCLHAKTGRVFWTHDLGAACWTTALLVDGKVYICDEDGDVTIFRHLADPHVAMKAIPSTDGQTEFIPGDWGWRGEILGEINMGNSIYVTPIVANNVLYIATKTHLFAIQEMPESPPAETSEPRAAP